MSERICKVRHPIPAQELSACMSAARFLPCLLHVNQMQVRFATPVAVIACWASRSLSVGARVGGVGVGGGCGGPVSRDVCLRVVGGGLRARAACPPASVTASGRAVFGTGIRVWSLPTVQ